MRVDPEAFRRVTLALRRVDQAMRDLELRLATTKLKRALAKLERLALLGEPPGYSAYTLGGHEAARYQRRKR